MARIHNTNHTTRNKTTEFTFGISGSPKVELINITIETVDKDGTRRFGINLKSDGNLRTAFVPQDLCSLRIHNVFALAFETNSITDACKVIQFIKSLVELDEESTSTLIVLLEQALTSKHLENYACSKDTFAEAMKTVLRSGQSSDIKYHVIKHFYQNKKISIEEAKKAYLDCLETELPVNIIDCKNAHYELAKMVRESFATTGQTMNSSLFCFEHFVQSGELAKQDFSKQYLGDMISIHGRKKASDLLGKCNDNDLGIYIAKMLVELQEYQLAFTLLSKLPSQNARIAAAHLIKDRPEQVIFENDMTRRKQFYDLLEDSISNPEHKQYLVEYFEEKCTELAAAKQFTSIISDTLYIAQSLYLNDIYYSAGMVLREYSPVMACSLFSMVKEGTPKYDDACIELLKLTDEESKRAVENFNKILQQVIKMDYKKRAEAIEPVILKLMREQHQNAAASPSREAVLEAENQRLREENDKLRKEINELRPPVAPPVTDPQVTAPPATTNPYKLWSPSQKKKEAFSPSVESTQPPTKNVRGVL